ncbi:HNH endonuclease [Streptomyces antibioticus]|uniref:HNH endonuclease n=1 Tax=Streptomyces antibioticus TaxID=1890 RepID=UPI0037014EDF
MEKDGDVTDLPAPDSPEITALLPEAVHRRLYSFLYARSCNPPTMREVRAHLAQEMNEAPSQTDRRLRDLYDVFEFSKPRRGRDTLYKITAVKSAHARKSARQIDRKKRAQVLAPGRCAKCGRSPLSHGVVLVVDHILPRNWGGDEEIENLQPLCEECNSGMKDHYSDFDPYANEIRQAALHPEPQGRIGNLLKAFRGEWVPSELISVIASMGDYQDDWTRRLRDLRDLGWDIPQPKKQKNPTTGRVEVWYRAASWQPWPQGTIREELSRRKRLAATGETDVQDIPR